MLALLIIRSRSTTTLTMYHRLRPIGGQAAANARGVRLYPVKTLHRYTRSSTEAAYSSGLVSVAHFTPRVMEAHCGTTKLRLAPVKEYPH